MLDHHHLTYVQAIHRAVSSYIDAVDEATRAFIETSEPDIWVADILGAVSVSQSAMRTLEYSSRFATDTLSKHLKDTDQ